MSLTDLIGKAQSALGSPLGQKIKSTAQSLLSKVAARNIVGTFDIFLKVEGIEGECKDAKHKGEILILDYEIGEFFDSKTLQFQNLQVGAAVDKSAPKLMQACAKGDKIPKVTLSVRKAGAGGQDFLKWTFSECLISFFKIAELAASSPVPLMYIEISYAQIEIEAKEVKPDGSLGGPSKAGWKLKENAPV